ncbi:hypothetical protein MY3296_009130 [Beauveria thailandica]
MPLPLFLRRLVKPKPTIYFISTKESRDSGIVVNMLQDSRYQMKRGDPARMGKLTKTIVLYDEMVDQERLFDLLTLRKVDILILIGDPSLKHYHGTVLADRCITVKRRGMDGIGPIQRVQVEDAAQTGAPVTALQNPLAIIQGPPGTGKSYVGLSARSQPSYFFKARLGGSSSSPTQTTRSIIFSRCSQASFESRARRSGISEHKSLLYMLKDELRSLREDVEYAFNKVAEKPSLEEIIDHLGLADEQESQLFWRTF